MDKVIAQSLQLLGLDSKEVKFFLTSFKTGPAPINQIAKLSRLERSTAYLIAEQLINKGLLEASLSSYRKKVSAVEPRKLLKLVAARQRQIRRQELELEESLPELQSLYQASEFRPKVRVFEGRQGLIQVWQDILSAKSEILLWTNQERETMVFTPQDHQLFIKERVSKRLPIRVLAVNNAHGQQLQEQSESRALRQTKLLSEQIQFSAETYIYDNKVAIIDYNKDIIGVIMESHPISDSQRAIFEMTWNQLDSK